MPRWVHFLFIVVWIIACCTFATQAYDAHQSLSLRLPVFQTRIPPEYNVQIGSVRFQDYFNALADSQREAQSVLESSIHASYLFTRNLNVVSFFAALFGFFAQVAAYLYEKKQQ